VRAQLLVWVAASTYEVVYYWMGEEPVTWFTFIRLWWTIIIL